MNGKFFLICSIVVAALYFLGMLSGTHALLAVIGAGIISYII